MCTHLQHSTSYARAHVWLPGTGERSRPSSFELALGIERSPPSASDRRGSKWADNVSHHARQLHCPAEAPWQRGWDDSEPESLEVARRLVAISLNFLYATQASGRSCGSVTQRRATVSIPIITHPSLCVQHGAGIASLDPRALRTPATFKVLFRAAAAPQPRTWLASPTWHFLAFTTSSGDHQPVLVLHGEL